MPTSSIPVEGLWKVLPRRYPLMMVI